MRDIHRLTNYDELNFFQYIAVTLPRKKNRCLAAMVSTAVVPVALPGECEGPEPAVSCGHGSYGMVVENNLGTAIEVWTAVWKMNMGYVHV